MIRNRTFLSLISAALLLACNPDVLEDLGGGFYYVSESRNDRIIVKNPRLESDPYIPCRVESFAYDDGYILARQHVLSKCTIEPSHDGPMKEFIGQDRYWIIDKRTGSIGKSLSLAEFKTKAEELRLSADLLRSLD